MAMEGPAASEEVIVDYKRAFQDFTPLLRPECPLCCLPMPLNCREDSVYLHCCSKQICIGCDYQHQTKIVNDDNKEIDDITCPFCRKPRFGNCAESLLSLLKKRVEANDADAMVNLGFYYYQGWTVQQNRNKAVELLHRASEVGSARASMGLAEIYGETGDEINSEKYYSLAAERGYVNARFMLGEIEYRNKNIDAATYHWRIAAEAGHESALNRLMSAYRNKTGVLDSKELGETLRNWNSASDGMKSEWREKASLVIKEKNNINTQ